MMMNEQPSVLRRVIDGCSFISCILLAIGLGVIFVISGSPTNDRTGPAWEPFAATGVRGLALGGPIAIVFGLPVFSWLRRRIQLPALVITLTGLAGVLPGIVVFFIGIAGHNDLALAGIYIAVSGVWSAALGSALYYLLRRVPALPISAAALLSSGCIVGAVVAS